eukprot:1606471-Rhodomonas_salina.1
MACHSHINLPNQCDLVAKMWDRCVFLLRSSVFSRQPLIRISEHNGIRFLVYMASRQCTGTLSPASTMQGTGNSTGPGACAPPQFNFVYTAQQCLRTVSAAFSGLQQAYAQPLPV